MPTTYHRDVKLTYGYEIFTLFLDCLFDVYVCVSEVRICNIFAISNLSHRVLDNPWDNRVTSSRGFFFNCMYVLLISTFSHFYKDCKRAVHKEHCSSSLLFMFYEFYRHDHNDNHAYLGS